MADERISRRIPREQISARRKQAFQGGNETRPARRVVRTKAPPGRSANVQRNVATTRPARRVRTTPIYAGDVITLFPDTGVGERLTVKAPDGLLLLVPVRGGSVRLWVPQVGTWIYRWDEAAVQSFDVFTRPAEAMQATTEEPPIRIEAG